MALQHYQNPTGGQMRANYEEMRFRESFRAMPAKGTFDIEVVLYLFLYIRFNFRLLNIYFLVKI